jgi:hypothetical protein
MYEYFTERLAICKEELYKIFKRSTARNGSPEKSLRKC